ncbi:uncharacterized protein B0I36DRAFT_392245 [Microdochium trichocladiopsis]|uniref:Uncharacterized protein n=1 Tax=Microdochium trichocladiopsis TaxID=1682393 RepID=A0A9P9BX82_9PEZI|nr:uncharacterized protein B0I36DRAFT_392245 [Microdochium trichocladiopsis]KAH7041325.1 hypothetical protein B0I36DRAFT_392245 [Microdochium trichocladiopsis]
MDHAADQPHRPNHITISSDDSGSAKMSVLLRDGGHPMAEMTRRNYDSCLFLKKLPLELRIMIYELALTHSTDIVPQQVTKYSFKFSWGASKSSLFKIAPGKSELHPWSFGDPLTISQLEQTCFSISQDLTLHPIFYRVNTFRFNKATELLRYLAAITPQRRRNIRAITLDIKMNGVGWCFSLRYHYDWLYCMDHVVLLSQCESLRRLSIIVDVRYYHGWFYSRHYRPQLSNVLESMGALLKRVKETTTSPTGSPSFFDLPSAALFLRLSDQLVVQPTTLTHSIVPISIDSAFGYDSLDMFSSAILQDEAFQSQCREFSKVISDEEALAFRRFSDSRSLITTEAIMQATTRAKIDMPGHLRAKGAIIDRAEGPIALRTRSSTVQKYDVDELGLFKHRYPKYSTDEFLLWGFSVKGLRWSGSEIEFHAVFESSIRKREPSWELLHVLPKSSSYGCGKIARFYYDTINQSRATRGASPKLAQLKSMPSPDAVIAVCHGAAPKRWVSLQKNFLKAIARGERFERSNRTKDGRKADV